jgi:hypothetical protein
LAALAVAGAFPSAPERAAAFLGRSDTMSRNTRTTTLLAALAVLGASCTRGPEAGSKSDTAQAAPPVVTASPGALASRREAQETFDRARAALERKDFTSAKTELANAAAFMRTQAQEAQSDAKAGLERAAAAFDTLATSVSTGTVQAKTLDRAFASANRAEAEHHLLRAKDALAKNDNARTGEELTMSVDHLERAVRDAGRQADAALKSAMADARTLAGEMMKGAAATPDEAKKVTDQLGDQIRRLGGEIVEGVKVRK